MIFYGLEDYEQALNQYEEGLFSEEEFWAIAQEIINRYRASIS